MAIVSHAQECNYRLRSMHVRRSHGWPDRASRTELASYSCSLVELPVAGRSEPLEDCLCRECAGCLLVMLLGGGAGEARLRDSLQGNHLPCQPPKDGEPCIDATSTRNMHIAQGMSRARRAGGASAARNGHRGQVGGVSGQRRRVARSWRPRPRRASWRRVTRSWRRASWRGQRSWRLMRESWRGQCSTQWIPRTSQRGQCSAVSTLHDLENGGKE